MTGENAPSIEEVCIKCYHHRKALKRERVFNVGNSKAEINDFLIFWTFELLR